MSLPDPEILNRLVARVFRIEDMTLGEPARGWLARYRGRLILEDSEAAYDQLAEALRPYQITPLFRQEKGQHIIYLAPSRAEPRPARPIVNLLLFLLTVLSVMFAGAQMTELPPTALNSPAALLKALLAGWPFAASLLGILLAHEFGHYLMSRYHNTPATLPYFIPFPFSPLGTMGAAILMQGTPKNKRILFDIGVAGPLAGMVIAIPVLFFGLSISSVQPITTANGTIMMEGNSLLYLAAKFIVFGKLLPAPPHIPNGLPLVLYWIRYFFTGRPLPLGGLDVIISPVAFAGWAGLLVTALNLLPAGTLDGGHVIYALLGDRAGRVFPYILGALLLLGMFWNGWWVWAVLLLWLGRVQAQPLDQITPLDPGRRLVAALVALIFVLTFSPVPFSVFG